MLTIMSAYISKYIAVVKAATTYLAYYYLRLREKACGDTDVLGRVWGF